MKPVYRIYALARRVLAVAVIEDTHWCAYIDAVPGKNHEDERDAVVYAGVKLRERIARSLFLEIIKPYSE